MIYRLLSLLIGYIFGIFSTSYFIGKKHGKDIRTLGSGNAGTTNTLRNFGIKEAVICFTIDTIKGFIACMICGHLFNDGNFREGLSLICMLYAGVGAALGHCFPFYLEFKGGKAAAVTFGSILAINWILALILLGAFIIVLLLSRFVSLGSIVGAILYFVLWLIFSFTGIINLSSSELLETSVLVFVVSALIIIKHKDNIVRLVSGTENKIGKKKE